MKKIVGLIIGLLVGGAAGYAMFTGANPAQFIKGTATGSATTTVAYQTQGTGTTTPSLDSYTNGRTTALNNAQLLVQWVGSSTASTLDIRIECSDDNIDWYQSCSGGGTATTTKFSLSYASSTAIGGSGNRPKTSYSGVTGEVNARAIDVDTPLRYTRAVISTPIGSLNNTVWAQFIAKLDK